MIARHEAAKQEIKIDLDVLGVLHMHKMLDMLKMRATSQSYRHSIGPAVDNTARAPI